MLQPIHYLPLCNPESLLSSPLGKCLPLKSSCPPPSGNMESCLWSCVGPHATCPTFPLLVWIIPRVRVFISPSSLFSPPHSPACPSSASPPSSLQRPRPVPCGAGPSLHLAARGPKGRQHYPWALFPWGAGQADFLSSLEQGR